MPVRRDHAFARRSRASQRGRGSRACTAPLADRLRLGHAVLVASPNEGTPLATPERWDQTVGWFANLMEVLPDNPVHHRRAVRLRGHRLAGRRTSPAICPDCEPWTARATSSPACRSRLVRRSRPTRRSSRTSIPTRQLWERALDVGVDAFFASANDLVVPSEGGWRVDRDGTPYVPGDRIGCFGPGGNLSTTDGGPVTHVNFFERPETATFLARALAGRVAVAGRDRS